jgi:hypothetical protein
VWRGGRRFGPLSNPLTAPWFHGTRTWAKLHAKEKKRKKDAGADSENALSTSVVERRGSLALPAGDKRGP